MGMPNPSRCARATAIAALILLANTRLLTAQAEATTGFDSFIMLVPPRDSISIKKNVRAAADAVSLADTRRQQAETMRLGARARIEAKKVEIVRIKDRINVAKKENRDADRAGLEAERKAAEREIDLLERREDLRQAETELETRRAEYAALSKKALELELQLAVRRTGRQRKAVGGAGGASLDRVIGELEKQTLEAQRAQAASSIEVSDQEIKTIDRRLELLDAQQKLSGVK
jgi:chromosome segregation ATPase